MKRTATLVLIAILCLSIPLYAGLDSKKAAYQGGTQKDQYFAGAKEAVVGTLNLDGETAMKFEYRVKKETKVFEIPYEQIIDIEYGQKAGRRVGAAIATAILISPVGLFLLFSKKRKHFVTIGYRTPDSKTDEVAVFELGKNIIRVSLATLEARTGKKIEYQDEEAKKSGKGN
jgi:hypothetical protein